MGRDQAALVWRIVYEKAVESRKEMREAQLGDVGPVDVI